MTFPFHRKPQKEIFTNRHLQDWTGNLSRELSNNFHPILEYYLSLSLSLFSSLVKFIISINRLAEKLKETQGTRENIDEEIKKKTEYLESLQPKLNTILQVRMTN